MNSVDLIAMIGNLSRSMYPVQHLITAGAYLIGIVLIFTALSKFHELAGHKSGSSQEKMFPALMYLLVGAALLYLPTMLAVLSNSVFGVGNVLTYPKSEPSNIYASMRLIIRTAGVIWFIRGSLLVLKASQPGKQQGFKGMSFMVAGVMAINFDGTASAISSFLSYAAQVTLAVKTSQGY